MEDKIFYLALIAIVALVALVAMSTNSAEPQMDSDLYLEEGDNLAGNAYRFRVKAARSYSGGHACGPNQNMQCR